MFRSTAIWTRRSNASAPSRKPPTCCNILRRKSEALGRQPVTGRRYLPDYFTANGMVASRPAILFFHSCGPVWWTDSPVLSTATVTGMSCTVNS